MLLQTALKLPFFEKFWLLNVKERAEGLECPLIEEQLVAGIAGMHKTSLQFFYKYPVEVLEVYVYVLYGCSINV